MITYYPDGGVQQDIWFMDDEMGKDWNFPMFRDHDESGFVTGLGLRDPDQGSNQGNSFRFREMWLQAGHSAEEWDKWLIR